MLGVGVNRELLKAEQSKVVKVVQGSWGLSRIPWVIQVNWGIQMQH